MTPHLFGNVFHIYYIYRYNIALLFSLEINLHQRAYVYMLVCAYLLIPDTNCNFVKCKINILNY
jgi:hypothetical protein